MASPKKQAGKKPATTKRVARTSPIPGTIAVQGPLSIQGPIPVTGEIITSGSTTTARQNWEYRVLQNQSSDPAALTRFLNGEGAAGWEFVQWAVGGYLYFKRPR